MEEQVLEDSQGARLESEQDTEESGPSTGALHSEETSVGSAAEADRENAEEVVWGRLRGEVARLLQEVGYTGPLLNEDNLARSTSSGAACQKFTSLCAWLVSELKAVASLEENISPTEGPEDAETFQLEMSGVVNELHCPYTSLTTGDVTRRLTSPQNCLQLLVFLSTELQAAQILKRKEVSKCQAREHKAEVLQELHLLCKVTGLPEPSLDAPVAEFMKELNTRISDIAAAASETAKSPPLLTAPLEPEQWETLKKLHDCMVIEYERRMRMMVTRLDVTVKSFHWSERAKEQGTAMDSVFWPLRQALPTESRICLSNILAARQGDSRILHTCSASFCQNTRSAVNKVMMMGTVPDRGGRPNEIEPPMPTWEKRREGGGGGHQRWEKKSKKKTR